jgi:predicted 3-demethylubiquinone-9 3-methyltransferase (glyoxalase superfamily)
MDRIHPCLWFDDQAEEAAAFYVSVFENSKVKAVTRYGDSGSKASGRPKGSVMTVDFELDGHPFLALNGGPTFRFTEAISLVVTCKDQDEVDAYWEKLSKGGEQGPCGWLKDRYGLSWQIVPKVLPDLMRTKDPAKAERVMAAVMGMTKLDVEALETAAEAR